MDARARLQGLRVLIVEDELLIAMELEGLLRGLGCRPLEPAPSIGRALRLLADERPDVAVLDVNLQGERVTPVAEALRDRGIPFVLLTGYGRERLNDEALRDALHVRKPVAADQLRRALAATLARPAPGGR